MRKENNNIYIIVLNYDNTNLTKQCVKSCLAMEGQKHILLVDNNSKDKSYREIKQLYPEITLLEYDKNLGYAGGNNAGIRYSFEQGADYILILNNDTTVAPDLLLQLVKSWNRLDKPGALGCKVLLMDQPQVVNSFGTKLAYRPIHTVHLHAGETDGTQLDNLQVTDYIHGCAIFTSKQVIETVGLLDERYFLYWEDTDFSFRIKMAGYNLYCIPTAKIWHCVSGSNKAKSRTPAMQYYGIRNMLLFAAKNLPDYDAMQDAMDSLENMKKQKYLPLKNIMIKATRIAIEDYKQSKYGQSRHYFKNPEQYFEYYWRTTWINIKTILYNRIHR